MVNIGGNTVTPHNPLIMRNGHFSHKKVKDMAIRRSAATGATSAATRRERGAIADKRVTTVSLPLRTTSVKGSQSAKKTK